MPRNQWHDGYEGVDAFATALLRAHGCGVNGQELKRKPPECLAMEAREQRLGLASEGDQGA
jgi:hypothetical protein